MNLHLTQALVPYEIAARWRKDGGFTDSYAWHKRAWIVFPASRTPPGISSPASTIPDMASACSSSPPLVPPSRIGARIKVGEARR